MFLQSLQPSMGQNTTYFRMLQKLTFFFGNGTKDPFLLWDSQVQNFAISTFTRVKKMGSGHLYFWLIIRPKWHCTQLTSPAKPYFKCIVPSGPLPLTHNGLNSFLKTYSYSINLSNCVFTRYEYWHKWWYENTVIQENNFSHYLKIISRLIF